MSKNTSSNTSRNVRYADLADILNKVSKVSGVSIALLKSANKTAEVTQARHIYCYLARKQTGRSIAQIGSMVNRTRVATLQAIQKIQGFVDIGDIDTLHLLGKLAGVSKVLSNPPAK